MAHKLCRNETAWGLLLRVKTIGGIPGEISQAAPYLSEEEGLSLLADSWLLLTFNKRDQAYECYYYTAGTNGHAEVQHNSYSGSVQLEAWVIGPDGSTHHGGAKHAAQT